MDKDLILNTLNDFRIFFGSATLLFLGAIIGLWLSDQLKAKKKTDAIKNKKKEAVLLFVLMSVFLLLTVVPALLQKPVVEAKKENPVASSDNKPDSQRTKIDPPLKKTKKWKANNNQANGQGSTSYSIGGGDSASEHSIINKTINAN